MSLTRSRLVLLPPTRTMQRPTPRWRNAKPRRMAVRLDRLLPLVPAPPVMLADKAIEPAEVWVKRILKLKKHGEAREFEDELAKFRKHYPNFKLPDELKTDK